MEESKRTIIGNDVFIGANVTVLDGIIIGNGAVVGAGAIVTKNIPPYAIAVGVPAKVIRYRFEKDLITKLQKIEWWNFNEEKLQNVEKYFFDIESFMKVTN
jgi:acetyltransferase-like isoleucine patch superfamily enzyme